MSHRIAVYTIVKNESKLLLRWYETIKDADAIYVLDTGSEDDTYGMLQDLASDDKDMYVFDATFIPFRFDRARNFLLEQIPRDYDYAMFIDVDEVMEEDWYFKLHKFIEEYPDSDAINTRMIYEEDGKGNPIYTYNRLQIHRPKHYVWHYPVHEVLVAKELAHETYSDIKVYHRPDKKKKRDYLEMLRLGYEEYDDARSAYYYAKELYYTGNYEYAYKIGIRAYNTEQNYLLRSEIAAIIGYSFEELNDYNNAKYWFIRCYSEAIDIRESWNHAAEFYFRNGRYRSALGCIENMLEITDIPEHTIIRHDNLYNERPLHLKALCYEQMGHEEEAQKYIQQAFTLSPKDQNLVADLLRIKKIPVKIIGEE